MTREQKSTAYLSDLESADGLPLATFYVVAVFTVMLVEWDMAAACYVYPSDRRNPCLQLRCHYGARCWPSPDGRRARCVCPTRCDQYGDAVGSRTVCGSDGRQYSSVCELGLAACRQLKNIEKRYDGQCDPCAEVSCKPDETCALDERRRPVCRCGGDVCTVGRRRNQRQQNRLFTAPPTPVCASDGRTYRSECAARRHACKTQRDITIVHRGQCVNVGLLRTMDGCGAMSAGDADVDSCWNRPCNATLYEECLAVGGLARCSCPALCDRVVRPVCASDGQTYDSWCHLHRHACLTRRPSRVLHLGPCDEQGPCHGHVCEYGATCSVQLNHARCHCQFFCSDDVIQQVCGSDGSTYDTECHLKESNCLKQNYVIVISRGPCNGCENFECRFYAVCEYDYKAGVPRCKCPSTCTEVEEKVCGSDGVTYLNECVLRMTSCRSQKRIHVLSHCHCAKSCEQVVCRRGGAVCVRGRCRCHETAAVCDNNTPLCASYNSSCELARLSAGMEFTEKLDSEDWCGDYGIPVVDKTTGHLRYCDVNNCPRGSHCYHKPTDSLPRRCCRQNKPMKKCSGTEFGCCPDGKTAAPGPYHNGCPSLCQCNGLGSYGSVCDPTTRQCACKPGVGGLRCDRCQPNFWGLFKIAVGRGGCTPCDCNVYGSTREDCDQTTGRCVCKRHVTGLKCDRCIVAGRQLRPHGCSGKNFRSVTRLAAHR